MVRYHEKVVVWVATKNMVNAKELVEHFDKTEASKMKRKY